MTNFGPRPAELGPRTARKPLSERAKSSVRGSYPHFPESAPAVAKVTDPDKQGLATPPYAAAAATSGRHVTGPNQPPLTSADARTHGHLYR